MAQQAAVHSVNAARAIIGGRRTCGFWRSTKSKLCRVSRCRTRSWSVSSGRSGENSSTTPVLECPGSGTEAGRLSGLLQLDTLPRVIGRPHPAEFWQRTHSAPCRSAACALGLALQGTRPSSRRRLTTIRDQPFGIGARDRSPRRRIAAEHQARRRGSRRPRLATHLHFEPVRILDVKALALAHGP